MKRELKISALVIVLLSLTQFGMANIQSDGTEQTEVSDAKPLKVEEGAIKVGEESSKEKIEKSRGLSLSLIVEGDKEKSNANMNIGKLEFFVK